MIGGMLISHNCCLCAEFLPFSLEGALSCRDVHGETAVQGGVLLDPGKPWPHGYHPLGLGQGWPPCLSLLLS